MNRLTQLFNNKKGSILNVYCTAGYPELGATIPVMHALQQHGADIIELGMPYSDPLADGPVIQLSSAKALENGMTIELLFEQLSSMRKSPTEGGVGDDIPVLLMGYLNPVLQYGFENFCEQARKVGIDGLIIPDLPPFEFESFYSPMLKKYQLDFVFLVTPETSDDRIAYLDSLSTGFLYAVSSSSTTGSNSTGKINSSYLERIASMNLENPVLVGFGISDRAAFGQVSKYARGAIIGSAYVKALETSADVNATTKYFLSSILT